MFPPINVTISPALTRWNSLAGAWQYAQCAGP
jgi:hypothetical protein